MEGFEEETKKINTCSTITVLYIIQHFTLSNKYSINEITNIIQINMKPLL